MNKERLKTLSRDLRSTPPRSPRETLGGFVFAARMLDKARADLLGINGEYNFIRAASALDHRLACLSCVPQRHIHDKQALQLQQQLCPNLDATWS